MKGSSLGNDVLEKVSDIIQIPRKKVMDMEINDLIFHIEVLTMPIKGLAMFEDENESDVASSIEMIEYLKEQLNNRTK